MTKQQQKQREPEPPGRRAFRWLRWTVAILLVGAAAGTGVAWRLDKTTSCDSTTIDRTVPARSGTATHEQTTHCSPKTLTTHDLAPVALLAGLLLLPDFRRLKVGGLEFERLSEQVDRQAETLSALNHSVQQVSTDVTTSLRASLQNLVNTTINNGPPTWMTQLANAYRDLESLRTGRELTDADKHQLGPIDRSYQVLSKGQGNELHARATVALINALVAEWVNPAAEEGDSVGQALTLEELQGELPPPTTEVDPYTGSP